jgi:phenylpyruvate tautomerase PptA (4-oxalocrotonate tautomerase family)
MPSALIEVCTARTPAQETALIDAVHGALVEAFRLPPDDGELRLVVHAPHRLHVGADRAHPELFTLITIDAFAGRSVDAKRALYRAIVDRLEPLGIPRDHVMTVLHDVPRENWGLRGGRAGCDVDLGFTVEV